MSKSSGKVPSKEVCEERCQEFAAVTGTDTALAQFYLQDRDWDVRKALNAFFEAGSSPPRSKSDSKKSRSSSGDGKASSSAASEEGPVLESKASKEHKEKKRIRILSWNIDGIDENNLVTRTKAACAVIQKEKPDVVFLQEVVPDAQEVIEDACPQYQLIQSNTDGYYTMMLLSCESVTFQDQKVTAFPSSKMARNMLKVNCAIKGVDCLLITSHLESTKEHAAERTRQLKSVFKVMSDAKEEKTVVFGGDLNLRDSEVTDAGGLPENVYDMWEVTGKRPEAKYTWDQSRNDNLEMSGKHRPKCRFDRLYIKHPKAKPRLKPVYFELVGLEKVKKCGRFPSDHWGILGHFDKKHEKHEK